MAGQNTKSRSIAPPARAADTKASERQRLQLQREREKAQKAAEKEKLLLQKEREKVKQAAEKEKLLLQKEREKVKQAAEKEKQRLEHERQKAKELAAKEKERLARERHRLAQKLLDEKAKAKKEAEAVREALRREKEAVKERLLKEKREAKERLQREVELRRQEELREKQAEVERKEAEKRRRVEEKEAAKERLRLEQEAAKERIRLEREAEKDRARQDREAEKERLRSEREAEKDRQRVEREAEKERLRKEREAEKERIRLEREAEKERLRKEKEKAQEAYRKAKEAEQQRLRSEREAARKALEGRVSAHTARIRSAARVSNSSRVYSPSAIPDQSGTRLGGEASKFANLRTPPPPSTSSFARRPPTLPPPPPEAKPESFEERHALIGKRLAKSDEEFRSDYEHNLLMSWIYHDSALEGVVYTYDELRTGTSTEVSVVPDSSLQSVCDAIRRHREAISLVKQLGTQTGEPVTLSLLKRIYWTLHPTTDSPEEVTYRQDIPQHRLYFHEYCDPAQIAERVLEVFEWLQGPEPKKLKTPLKVASKLHYDLLRIFPFEKDCGKVVRLFTNLFLLRHEHPPAIIHLTERQRYYEALKGTPAVIYDLLYEAVDNGLLSVERILDERETRHRAIV